MSLRKKAAWGAIVLAPLLVVQTGLHHWGTAPWWPLWIDDLAAAALLAGGGWRVIVSETSLGSRLLSGGFAAGIFAVWSTLFTGLRDNGAEVRFVGGGVVAAIELVVLVCLVAGFICSLPSAKPTGRTKPRSGNDPLLKGD